MELRLARLLLATGLLSTVALTTRADEACTGPDSGTYYAACVLGRETAELDVELNKSYRLLLKNRSNADAAKRRQTLVQSQQAWIRFRNKICEFENEEIGGINFISGARCQNRLTRERLQYLRDLEP